MRDGFDVPAELRQTGDNTWAQLRKLIYGANSQTFTIDVGEESDGASSPRLVAWLVARMGRWTRCAILHDHLWRIEVPARRITYREADGIFRQALRREGVAFAQRWLMWAAVRWGALLSRPGGHIGWWRDAPAVLLWTLIGLPLAALPAWAGLPLLALIEAICWVPLRLFTRKKQVNPPKVTLRV